MPDAGRTAGSAMVFINEEMGIMAVGEEAVVVVVIAGTEIVVVAGVKIVGEDETVEAPLTDLSPTAGTKMVEVAESAVGTIVDIEAAGSVEGTMEVAGGAEGTIVANETMDAVDGAAGTMDAVGSTEGTREVIGCAEGK